MLCFLHLIALICKVFIYHKQTFSWESLIFFQAIDTISIWKILSNRNIIIIEIYTHTAIIHIFQSFLHFPKNNQFRKFNQIQNCLSFIIKNKGNITWKLHHYIIPTSFDIMKVNGWRPSEEEYSKNKVNNTIQHFNRKSFCFRALANRMIPNVVKTRHHSIIYASLGCHLFICFTSTNFVQFCI